MRKRMSCEYCGTYTRLYNTIPIAEIKNYENIGWPEKNTPRKTVRLCNHCETRLHTSDESEVK